MNRYVDLATGEYELIPPKEVSLPESVEVDGSIVTTLKTYTPESPEWDEQLQRWAFLHGFVQVEMEVEE